MKKLLLFAASALVGFSALAQTQMYIERGAIASYDELESGLYFIKIHMASNGNTTCDRGEALMYGATDRSGYISTQYQFPDLMTTSTEYIYQIDVTSENLPEYITEGTTKVFTIKNLKTNSYFSKVGSNTSNCTGTFKAKGDVIPTTNQDDIGQYQLIPVEMPEDHPEYYGVYTDNARFFMRLTNSQFSNSATNIQPAMIHNNTGTPYRLGYWSGYSIASTAVQFEFVKAEQVSTVDIKFNLPAINGWPIPEQTITVPLNESPVDYIKAHIENNLDYGDFKLTGITSEQGETTTVANQEFTVQGTWARELIPNHVYRIRVKPSLDATGALRYMLSTSALETRREGKATLDRLVPERLWYFTEKGEGENKTYTIHTLYDTTKGIHFDETGNGATASLNEEATEFKMTPRDNGYFVLNIAGHATSMVNDYNDAGLFSICVTSEIDNAGNMICLYPVNDDDFEALAIFSDEETIAAAKANPTVESIKPLVEAYNAHNLEAALKRVDYLTQDNIILGSNPGQYADANGEFAAAVDHAREVLAKIEYATEQEIFDAIAAIDINNADLTSLTRNEMQPGAFYRFRNVTSGKYMSILPGGSANNHAVMALTEDGTRSNTVFYALANNTAENEADVLYTLVAFENGLVMSKFDSAANKSWMPTLNTIFTTDAETGETVESANPDASNEYKFSFQSGGFYSIHASAIGGHRHLHGAGTTVNCSGNSNNADHGWYIERVNELPVTLYNIITKDDEDTNDGWASICSPVALEVPADRLLTAYTGQFDGTDYSEVAGINHVLATPIAPNAEGKVIIPANQPVLLFFDGENNDFNISADPNINETLMSSTRGHIAYVNLPIVYGGEEVAEDAVVGNLKGHTLAHAVTDGKEYYTLHATHSNNFREYFAWEHHESYVPGFKAHIENDPDGVDVYPIYHVNPNTMVPVIEDENGNANIKVVEAASGEEHQVTIIMPDENYEVFYKRSDFDVPAEEGENEPKNIRRRATEAAEGYAAATKSGTEHTFTSTPGKIEYYAVHTHPETGAQTPGVTRSFDLTTKGEAMPTSISSVYLNASEPAVIFDLQGRRMAAPVKGINIVNNKKVLVK